MAPAIVLIDALPKYVSPEQHRELVASTPASFNDIPPVLRHKEENVSITIDPALPEISAEDCANGSLYVIESALVFMSTAGRGFKVEYPSITLHAISRAENGPSVYCQLDESSPEAPTTEEDEAVDMRELVIVPKSAEALESIFEALSLCASLHPDPAGDDDMDDDDDAFIDADESHFEVFNGAEGEELSEVGRAALAHLESIIYDPFEKPKQNPEAFDDAEEEAADKPTELAKDH